MCKHSWIYDLFCLVVYHDWAHTMPNKKKGSCVFVRIRRLLIIGGSISNHIAADILEAFDHMCLLLVLLKLCLHENEEERKKFMRLWSILGRYTIFLWFRFKTTRIPKCYVLFFHSLFKFDLSSICTISLTHYNSFGALLRWTFLCFWFCQKEKNQSILPLFTSC